MTSPHVCDTCGAEVPTGAAALSWTVTVEDGRRWLCCEACSRAHLRAIESGLDRAWW